ncbi:cytosolic leucyl tRNA synthetase [Naganishia albida]|nr:cytosolic leucyl tRNA synthetase [Naganishia albida]
MAAPAVAANADTLEIKKTGKRDALIEIEKKAQQYWSEQKVFEINAPPPPAATYAESVDPETRPMTASEIRAQNPKWLGTFPYPYMNGSLHLGHAFSISKIEFACGFERMLGKRALFPLGFHCTGMPIKSSADKLIREMELFGQDFERYQDPEVASEAEQLSTPTALQNEKDLVAAPAASSDPSKAKKGKLAAKSTGLTYQFQIMELLGIPREEIKKFADPIYWMKYFPPIAQQDCNAMGARIDWRRSFVTTDVNPYYDSFVRWQMNELKAQGRIKFGERYTIYSPKDDQPCMDHDRASGEGVGPQEYTAIKMKVVEWSEGVSEDVKKAVEGKQVYMVAATLRPETMYGQTNCFVGTGINYGIYQASATEAFLITERAARNMAFQGTFEDRGKLHKLTEVKGADLVGTKVNPPFGVLPEIYVVPMEGVLANKGTGVVSCVPSDSPDDYATLMDLRKKAEYYKIKPEWVAHEPIPVLNTPAYGDVTAAALVAKLKINSQKDKVQLAEAKDIAYKEGFNNGTMLVGDFKGKPVQEAKPLVRKQLIEASLAVAYAEPENQVISRSADECVVALCDQWYLDYGVEDWKAKAKILVERMNTFFPEVRHSFEAVLDWLNQWACARSYGLGSKLPWDPQFLVESLSDSTIYMSYYTIANLLHEGSIYGDKVGPLGITADQMTDEVWRYVLSDGPFPEGQSLEKEKAAQLKYNYQYFYPMDVRSSGKDLIPNHLTFCIYIHAALFSEEYWPKAMRANGHLMLNGKKMSKSTGNFLTLGEAVKKFGADATRLTLADAGDELTDANFEELTANAAILRLHTATEWAAEMKAARSRGELRTGEWNSHDKAFKLEMDVLNKRTKKAYIDTVYKDSLKYGYYEYQSARDWYREVTLPENGGDGMHADLVFHFLRTSALMAQPFIPHYAEYIWRDILEENTTVQSALWPEVEGQSDEGVLAQLQYMRGVLSNMRSTEAAMTKKKGKGKTITYDPSKPRSARIFVASKYPAWQDGAIDVLREVYDANSNSVDDKALREKLQASGLIKDKRIMPFISLIKRKLVTSGTSVFARDLPYSEIDALTSLVPYIKSSMKLQDVAVVSVEDALAQIEKSETQGEGWDKAIVERAEPESPEILFWNC